MQRNGRYGSPGAAAGASSSRSRSLAEAAGVEREAGAVPLEVLAAGAGSWPSEAAMLGLTFTSDSFLGPRDSSALACYTAHRNTSGIFI